MEEMKTKKASFLLRIAPRPNSAQKVQKVAAYPGLKNDMQTQGPKTIGHMNSYISMLDFTSVPAWIILYCLTAGDCFSCCSANLFLSGILHWIFSGSRHGYFGVPARGPPCGVKSADWDFLTWFTPWFKRCGPSLGFFIWFSPNFFIEYSLWLF
jgi:hypothetical protein